MAAGPRPTSPRPWASRAHASGAGSPAMPRRARPACTTAPRDPHHSPRRTPPALEAAVLAIRRRERLGRDAIADRLPLSPRTVSRILARRGMPHLDHLDLGPVAARVGGCRSRKLWWGVLSTRGDSLLEKQSPRDRERREDGNEDYHPHNRVDHGILQRPDTRIRCPSRNVAERFSGSLRDRRRRCVARRARSAVALARANCGHRLPQFEPCRHQREATWSGTIPPLSSRHRSDPIAPGSCPFRRIDRVPQELYWRRIVSGVQ